MNTLCSLILLDCVFVFTNNLFLPPPLKGHLQSNITGGNPSLVHLWVHGGNKAKVVKNVACSGRWGERDEISGLCDFRPVDFSAPLHLSGHEKDLLEI